MLKTQIQAYIVSPMQKPLKRSNRSRSIAAFILAFLLAPMHASFAAAANTQGSQAPPERSARALEEHSESGPNWISDFKVARAIATKEGKRILLYNQESQPVAVESGELPGQELESRLFSKSAFAALTSDLVLYKHVPSDRPYDPADTLGIFGIPGTVVLISDSGLIYQLSRNQMSSPAGFQRALWITELHERISAAAVFNADAAAKLVEMKARWNGFKVQKAVSEDTATSQRPTPRRAMQGTYTIHGDFSAALKSGDVVLFQSDKTKSAGASMGMMGASSGPKDEVPGEFARTPLVDGKFTFTGEVDSVRPVHFYVLNAMTWKGRRMGPTKGQGFILEPGEYELTMNASHKHRVVGGYFNDHVYGSWQGSEAFQDLQALIPFAYYSVPGETDSQAESRNRIGGNLFNALMDAETAGRRKLALVHPDLLVRQLVLETAWLGGTWVLESARGILTEDPDNEWAKQSVASGEARLAKKRRNVQAAQVGGRYLPFTADSITGQATSLSKVCKQNKYVLLEYWASWCGPCRSEIPHLKEAYQHYNSLGFEIFAYTLDDDQAAWEKASSQEKLPWINTGLGVKSDPVLLYEVTGVPANYLIDTSTGMVIARDLRGDQLGLKLKELLGTAKETAH